MFCCCANTRRNCCCNFRNNCCSACGCDPCRCNRCCPAPGTANVNGEAFTTEIHSWVGIEEVPVYFDGFRLENMLSGAGGTALVVQRGGCYDLEYLVTISSFDTVDPVYVGVDVVMAVNGTLLTPARRVDPTGAFDFPAVATDIKPAVQLNRGDKITLLLRATTEGDLTVTPSAWLEARRKGDTC